MYSSYKIEGVVIKRSNFGEADKIITILSKNYGKIKALAKGVRKIKSRRAAHIELFNHTKMFLYKGQNLDIISEAEIIESFKNLKKNLKKIATSFYLSELIDKFCPEEQEHNDIFDEFIIALKLLDDTSFVDIDGLMNNFSRMLLTQLGFMPKDHILEDKQIKYFIEEIIEKKLKTSDLLMKI